MKDWLPWVLVAVVILIVGCIGGEERHDGRLDITDAEEEDDE